MEKNFLLYLSVHWGDLIEQIKKIVIYTLNDRDRLTKWGHQLVEQAINTSSGNLGDVITLIIHIVVIVEDQ